jgi:hypothetical protein
MISGRVVVLTGLTPITYELQRFHDTGLGGVQWIIFKDINIVNVNYQLFNAANWPLTDCGLPCPETLTAVTPLLSVVFRSSLGGVDFGGHLLVPTAYGKFRLEFCNYWCVNCDRKWHIPG